MSLIQIIVILNIYFVFFCSAQANLGDSCRIRKTGRPGMCESLRKCSIIFQDLRRGKIDHTTCGYIGHEPIVCCPITVVRTTSPPYVQSNRISAQKCNEYKSAVFEKIEIITTIGSKPHEHLVRHCAMDTIPLIVGGVTANSGEFPHMALIGYTTDTVGIKWACGGSLISDKFVLTASHCIRTSIGDPEYVKLGAHKLILNNNDEDHSIEIPIIQSYTHPEYRSSSKYNDIGLVELKNTVKFDQFIRPACLAEPSSPNVQSGVKVLASGWGHQEFEGQQSDTLRKVVLEMFNYEQCKKAFESSRRLSNGIVDETQICAGSHTEEKDTCQGDSGGPLQKQHSKHDCMYSIVGITSFGKGCGVINSPGVYTRVSAYLSWIEGIVWPNQ